MSGIHWRKARGYEAQRRDAGGVEQREPHGPALDRTLRRIGFRARLMRENLGWSVARAAQAAEVAPETLVRLEAGRHIPR
ncbi:MAG TPA: helix-turn-helix domain-containing protein, partial [Caldilineaceae bacterium]|nr:helix-turn-helix domain-containing protein [Caldilineaceae bacterium]